MNRYIKLALAVSAVIAAGSAAAATATATFPVSASVASNCIAAAGPLAFGGTYAPGSGALTQNTTISVRCSVGTSFTVGLDAGTFLGATVTTRRMSNGGLPLEYTLSQDAGHTTNWGNTPGADTPASALGLGMGVPNAVPFVVYGRVPDTGANLLATSGSYTDTITVNVVY